MFETLIPSGAAGQAVAWLLTYALHSTLFLGLALVLSRRLAGRWARLEEAAWRFALVAALATSTLQLAAGWEPVAGRWALDVPSSSAPASLAAASESSAAPAVASRPARRAVSSIPVEPAAEAPAWKIAAPTVVSAALGLWACGALLLALHWGWLSFRLRRHLRARPEVIGGGMFGLLRQLTAEQGLPQDVRLTCSSRVSVPVALGLARPEICVPPRALSHLEPEQQQGMLAHELAHLVRRDPFWLTFSHLTACVLFFQPLNWVARRRLREISERLCDEWAVERTGRPLSLARCLAEVAGWSVQPVRPLPVPSMADRPSSLARRIRHLLDDGRSPERRVRPLWLGVGMAVLLLGVSAVAPGVYAAATEPAQEPAFRLAQAVEPVEPMEPEEPVEPGEPVDADADVDLDLDLDEEPFELLDHELENLATEMASFAELAAFEDLGHLSRLAELGDLGDLGALGDFGLTDEELERITAMAELSGRDAEAMAERYAALAEEVSEKYAGEFEALSERIATEMEPQLERISEDIDRKLSPEIERISDEISRKLEPELERISERVANELEPEMERLHEEARRLHREGRLDDGERERLRREARELSHRARPSDEEMKAIREMQRKHSEEVRSFMEKHRPEIEAATRDAREQAEAMRKEMHRRMESDPKLRELRENYRRDMEQIRERHREEMRRHREEMREDRERSREKGDKDKVKEKEKKAA